MFSLSSNFSDFGNTSPPAGHLFGAVGLLRPAIFGRCPAFLPKHFEIQGLKGCLRHFQHHAAAVTHDLGGDVNHPAAQRGGMANGLEHRRANVLLEAIAEKSGLVRLALRHKSLDRLIQLAAALVSFSSKIRENRGKPIISLLCSRHPFFFRLGIVKGTDVYTQGSHLALTGGYRANPGNRLANQFCRLLSDDAAVKSSVHDIQPLPEGRTGGTLINDRAVSEKRNIQKPLNRVRIRLTRAQQLNHRFYNVSVRNPSCLTSRQNGGIDSRGQLCPMKQCPDQRQAPVANQMPVTFFDDKFHRSHFHPYK